MKQGAERRGEGPEPLAYSMAALVAVGALQWALPHGLSFGPKWLLLAVVSVLVAPVWVTHRQGRHGLNQVLGFVTLGVIAAFLTGSLGLLVWRLPAHQETPLELLVAAGSLWVSNILVFASLYWRLDAGGPHERHRRTQHVEGAFLFPQMTMGAEWTGWKPGFVDYLFLAFNTSTAFSPTDVPVLSKWAKGAMMAQALISLGTIVLLAARAVNVL